MDFMTLLRSQWDRLLGGAFAVVGLIVLVVGWFGVSGTPYVAEQLPYVVGDGLGGLFCLGVAAVLWLSADLHDEWRKLDRIEQALLTTTAESHASPGADDAGITPIPLASAAARTTGHRHVGAKGSASGARSR